MDDDSVNFQKPISMFFEQSNKTFDCPNCRSQVNYKAAICDMCGNEVSAFLIEKRVSFVSKLISHEITSDGGSVMDEVEDLDLPPDTVCKMAMAEMTAITAEIKSLENTGDVEKLDLQCSALMNLYISAFYIDNFGEEYDDRADMVYHYVDQVLARPDVMELYRRSSFGDRLPDFDSILQECFESIPKFEPLVSREMGNTDEAKEYMRDRSELEQTLMLPILRTFLFSRLIGEVSTLMARDHDREQTVNRLSVKFSESVENTQAGLGYISVLLNLSENIPDTVNDMVPGSIVIRLEAESGNWNQITNMLKDEILENLASASSSTNTNLENQAATGDPADPLTDNSSANDKNRVEGSEKKEENTSETEERFCRECGKNISEYSDPSFCPGCGKEL